MKTLISVIIICFCQLILGQPEAPKEISPYLTPVPSYSNSTSYLEAITGTSAPAFAQELRRQAVAVNLDDHFEKSEKGHGMTLKFKVPKGALTAVYNARGGVVLTLEKYRNVVLPKAIKQRLLAQHPGWTMVANEYHSKYHNGTWKKERYLIALRREGNVKEVQYAL